MTADWYDVEKSLGGKRIEQYCKDDAKNLGLDLVRTSWSINLVADEQKYILTIIARSGTTQLAFAREEIDQFARTDAVEITTKIKQALKDVL